MMMRLSGALTALVIFASPAWADFIGGRDAYLNGDYEEAYREFAAAATVGDAKSQIGLGLLHTWGQGTQRDLTEAYKWFQVAAMQDGAVNPVVRILAQTNRNFLEQRLPRDAVQRAMEQVSNLVMRRADTDDEVWEDIFAAAPTVLNRGRPRSPGATAPTGTE